jgi:hypothetical protein
MRGHRIGQRTQLSGCPNVKHLADYWPRFKRLTGDDRRERCLDLPTHPVQRRRECFEVGKAAGRGLLRLRPLAGDEGGPKVSDSRQGRPGLASSGERQRPKTKPHEHPRRRLRNDGDGLNAAGGKIDSAAVKDAFRRYSLSRIADRGAGGATPVMVSREQTVLKEQVTVVAPTEVEGDLGCCGEDIRTNDLNRRIAVGTFNGVGGPVPIQRKVPGQEVAGIEDARGAVRRYCPDDAPYSNRFIDRLHNIRRRGSYPEEPRPYEGGAENGAENKPPHANVSFPLHWIPRITDQRRRMRPPMQPSGCRNVKH